MRYARDVLSTASKIHHKKQFKKLQINIRDTKLLTVYQII